MFIGLGLIYFFLCMLCIDLWKDTNREINEMEFKSIKNEKVKNVIKIILLTIAAVLIFTIGTLVSVLLFACMGGFGKSKKQ